MKRREEATVALDTSFLARPPSGIRFYVQRMTALLPLMEKESGIRMAFLPGTENGRVPSLLPRKMQQAVWNLSSVARNPVSKQADLLHVPHLSIPFRSPLPTVVTIHDVIPLSWPEYRQSRSMQVFLKQIERSIGNAALIIVPSRSVANELPRYLDINPDRIRIIPMGVDPPSDMGLAGGSEETVLTRYGLSTGRYLFNIGGLDLRKNLPELVRAFATIAPDLEPDWKLVIGGEPHTGNPIVYPPLEPIIAELGVGDRVVLTGRIDEATKAQLYRHAGLYVTPSLDEGFGLTALEAMAWGVPTVVSNRGSLPEIAGDAALIVEPSAQVLADALLDLIHDKSRQEELKKRGLERVKEFTWSATARRTMAVYREILD